MVADEVKRAKVPRPVTPLGRINFVLRTLVVTAMAYAVEFLAGGLLHFDLLPHDLFAIQAIAVLSLFGMFWLRPLDGRLTDAGLARWYRYPGAALWLVSASLPIIWPQGSLFGLALFLLLLILGGAVAGRPVLQNSSPTKEISNDKEEFSTPSRKTPSLPLVDRIGFFRSLLTLACLWLPLIWLEDSSGNHPGAWFARLGYSILSVIWAIKVIGRLEDAGKAPSVRQGLLAIFLALAIGLMHRLDLRMWAFWRQIFPVFDVASALSQWLIHLDGYKKLGLFLLAQVPLASLPSKRRPMTPLSKPIGTLRNARQPVKAVKTNVFALCGPIEYLRILLVIAVVCIPLIYVDYASNSGVGSWIARSGYAVLAFFWLTFAHGRFKDAGWAHNEYPSQFFLVVSVASLMPLAVHWVGGYGALAIFVMVQIPTAFLKSVPLPDEES